MKERETAKEWVTGGCLIIGKHGRDQAMGDHARAHLNKHQKLRSDTLLARTAGKMGT